MTDLELLRKEKTDTYTIGELHLNGLFFCHTLEDTVRLDGVKVAGKTAIPAGQYKVILSMSNRFKKVMPELLRVPNFSGVRIHSGNTVNDTEGCILLGIDNKNGTIRNSRKYNELLMQELKKERGEIWITIS